MGYIFLITIAVATLFATALIVYCVGYLLVHFLNEVKKKGGIIYIVKTKVKNLLVESWKRENRALSIFVVILILLFILG